MNAGDTFYASFDADPERDGVTWNPRLTLGPSSSFNSTVLIVSDSSTTSPNSEAYIMTIKQAGTYTLLVDAGATRPGDPTFTYQMSLSIYPPSDRRCTTYTNTTPVTIPTGPDSVTSTINIPDNVRISNLQVSLDISHLSMPDLDLVLTSPAGNDVILFVDRGQAGGTPNSSFSRMNVTLDDEGGIDIIGFNLIYNMVMEPQTRLGWFKGENAAGTWTLKIYDDTANNGGTLNSWGITVCEDPPLACPAQLTQTLYSSDFEANDGGFTHSGTLDEWERGTPTGASAPITTCNSGTNCWKTDLDNTYDASSSQDLLSPSINLTSVQGRQIKASWAQKYQIESATFDQAFVEIREVGNPSNSRRLWNWDGITMQVTAAEGNVGNPAVTVNASSGWGIMEYDISEFGGKTVELRFHLDSDTGLELSGLAIDDVMVTACRQPSRGDFNGNGPTDLSVFRPDDPVAGSATWYINANGVVTQQQFGASSDKPVPGDYDGDGDVDIAVWRPGDGIWYIVQSFTNTFRFQQWGLGTDTPVTGDYDGDRQFDIAVYRASDGYWYILQSTTNGLRAIQWGIAGDIPVPSDFDGDRKFDTVVFRPSDGSWNIRRSSDGGLNAAQWGQAGDTPAPRGGVVPE